MNIDMFWSLVERVHARAPDDMKEKCRLLADELRSLSCEELLSFDEHFRDLFFEAYNWELWAAAYLMKRGGCSNDSFMDFRSTLISLGRAAYETALRDVDSLADFNIDPAWATYEGYQYVAPKVYEEKGCPPHGQLREARPEKPHPKKPTGRDWEDWDLHERYPRLAAKYGWEKQDWSKQKEAHAKFLDHMAKGRQLAQLMLDAGIIPSCGLIPLPRIAREILHSGRSPFPAATVQTWHPFTLDEGHYWIAARAETTLRRRSETPPRSHWCHIGRGHRSPFGGDLRRVAGLLKSAGPGGWEIILETGRIATYVAGWSTHVAGNKGKNMQTAGGARSWF